VSSKKTEVHVPFKPAADGKFYCPECKAGPYENPRGMSSHRRSAHGIQGKSKSAIETRDRKESVAPPSPKDAAAQRRREERDYKREYRLRAKREQDGAPTLPAPVPLEHEPKQVAALATTKENAQDASSLGQKKRGPYKPRRSKKTDANRKGLATTSEVEIHLPQPIQNYYDPRNPPRIPESTVAVAFGRLLEFSASLAREYDLPQRQFTSELFALVRRST